MTQIKIKRVHDAAERSDGFRVLVDRLWPRGMKKENLHYDLWAKDITPSTSLREWYHQDEESHWEVFKKKYMKELKESPAVKDFVNQIKGRPTVILLIASKNEIENHALILQNYLDQVLN